MAVVRSTTGTVEQSNDATFDAGGTAVTGSFDAGSDADRYLALSVAWAGANAHTMPDNGVSYNSIAMSNKGATTSQSGLRLRSYELIAPASGSNPWSVDPSTGVGSSPAIVVVHCYSGVDQTTWADGYATGNAADASAPLESSVTVSSATDDMVHVVHAAQGNGIASGVATGFTERTDNVIDSGSLDIGALSGNQPGAASVATSVAWTGPAAINWAAHGWNLNAAASAVELAVADMLIALASESPALTQANTLAANDALIALAAESPELTQANVLAVLDALIALSAESPALTQANTLAIAGALIALSAESPALVQANVLAVADSLIALASEEPVLTFVALLVVADALIALAAESPALVQANLLAVADSLIALAIDRPDPSADGVEVATGKYKPEHDAALADLAAATGFSGDHASALRDLFDAGV